MYDERVQCDRFDQWLLDSPGDLDSPVWRDHLEGCAECRQQWQAHRMLASAFADEAMPELSLAFDAALDRKLTSAVELRPLRGWRRAAMLAYVVAAMGILGWALKGVPLPTFDLSSPWVPVTVLLAVPLTFMLAIAASRLIPTRGLPKRPRMLTL